MRASFPRLRPLSAAIAKQAGFGLTETLLVIGAVSIMSLAVYGIFFASDVTAEVKTEQNNLNQLSTAVDRSFGLTGGFSGLSLDRAQQEGLLPSTYQRSGATRTEWGSTIDVRANTVARANDSFIIDYASVPANACSKLAAAMAPNVYGLRIGGANVMTPEGLNAAAAASACSAGARMEFIYYSGLTSGTAVATPGLTLPTAPPSVDPANPTTPTGPVAGAPSVDDATPGTPGVVAPGTPVAPPPVAPPAPAAPSVPSTPQPIPGTTPGGTPPPLSRCVPDPVRTNDRSVAGCPAGQWGLVQQQQATSSSCPEAWDAPVTTWGAWYNTGNTCQACPAARQERTTQWVTRSAACPSGTTGMASQQWEQQAFRNISYNCPAGTTSSPPATVGGWSAWSDTGVAQAINTSGCTPIPPPANGCSVMTDWSTGVLDVSDAYYSISYSLNGGGNSCSVSMRDDGPSGAGSGKCNQGSNGILDMSQWEQQAADGDTYYIGGSQSGWGGGRGEFWGYDNYTYVRVSGAACSGGTSSGNYTILDNWGSGNSQPYGCRGGVREENLNTEIRAACSGQRAGTVNQIDYCSDSASHTYFGTAKFVCS